METMTKLQRVPQTDSIDVLAAFWESHDVTDFEDELEEVSEPLFERVTSTTIQIELPEKEFAAIQRIAHEQQLDYAGLVRDWVLEKLYYAEMMRQVAKEFQR